MALQQSTEVLAIEVGGHPGTVRRDAELFAGLSTPPVPSSTWAVAPQALLAALLAEPDELEPDELEPDEPEADELPGELEPDEDADEDPFVDALEEESLAEPDDEPLDAEVEDEPSLLPLDSDPFLPDSRESVR